MPGIDPGFLTTIYPSFHMPNSWPKEREILERSDTINKEVTSPLEVRFIREVTYTTWLTNVVMVKKASSK